MDSDDEKDVHNSWRGVPGTVVLINTIDKEVAKIAHGATCRMVRQYLRAAISQHIAVCLYGTDDEKDANSAFGSKSVVEVLPLAKPSLEDYKKLRNIQISTFEPTKEFKLSDALWQCSKIFTNCKKQLSSKTIILLTSLDKAPVIADQKPTLKRVVDLVDSNIDIKIVNIAKDVYTVDPFYEKFLIEAHKGVEDFVMPQPIWDEKEIEAMMRQESHRHLAVARINFEIGEGVSIGVGVFNLLIKSTYQKTVNLERDSNAILSSVTKTMKVSKADSDSIALEDGDEATSQERQIPLLKSEVLHYQTYGGERIEFTDNEMKKLKNPFGPPLIKLLGFKPSNLLSKEKWFLKSGYFLYPNEDLVEGSTVAFKALHKACVETGVVALCVLTTRVNSRPVIVALSPCSKPLSMDVEIGFDVIHIPFMENVRDIQSVLDEESPSVTEEQKDLMQNILKKLQFDFKSDMFENPKLQSEYRAIEAIALDDDDLDEFVDTTKPPPERFTDMPLDRFTGLFGSLAEQTAPKRQASSNQNGSAAAKRIRAEGFTDSYVQDMIKTKNVHKFTVPQLQDILRRSGNPRLPPLTSLKKKELVDLVYQHREQ